MTRPHNLWEMPFACSGDVLSWTPLPEGVEKVEEVQVVDELVAHEVRVATPDARRREIRARAEVVYTIKEVGDVALIWSAVVIRDTRWVVALSRMPLKLEPARPATPPL